MLKLLVDRNVGGGYPAAVEMFKKMGLKSTLDRFLVKIRRLEQYP
ncbi:MAG: hypothetical protein OXC80_07245 [Gammaproteobacteria bacterium]|nr:hypothetical protein [Gammaproteobacteria bacterium]